MLPSKWVILSLCGLVPSIAVACCPPASAGLGEPAMEIILRLD